MTYAQRAVAAVLGTHDDARMLTMISSSWRRGEEFGPEFRARQRSAAPPPRARTRVGGPSAAPTGPNWLLVEPDRDCVQPVFAGAAGTDVL